MGLLSPNCTRLVKTPMSLKIVGAGHLGLRVALLWKQTFPDADVYLKTRNNNPERTSKWKSLGFNVLSSVEEDNATSRVVAPFVVFSAPPTNNPEYAKLVEDSIKFDRDVSTEGKSAFVFTGSGGVLAENAGNRVDESSPVKTSSERSASLLHAEEAVLNHGGVVMRFAGLYTRTRGAHNYWLSGRASEFSSRPNGLINLVHYDDAANCVMKALLAIPKVEDKRLFLVSDGVPISRVDIVNAALKCPTYADRIRPTFTGDESIVDGKKYDTSLVRKTFDWKPSFDSFQDFMVNHYENEMNIDQFWSSL